MKNMRAVLVAAALMSLASVACGADAAPDTEANPFSDLITKLTAPDGFKMQTDAMEPTIKLGEKIVAAPLPYRDADPHVGDVIVFTYSSNTARPFVGRVIAVGDTTIEIRKGVVLIAGVAIRDDYAPETRKKLPGSQTMTKAHVPAGDLFVMGDNRDHSKDSRQLGFVPRDLVIGKIASVSGPAHNAK